MISATLVGRCHHLNYTDEYSEVSGGYVTCTRSLEYLASTNLPGLKFRAGSWPLLMPWALVSRALNLFWPQPPGSQVHAFALLSPQKVLVLPPSILPPPYQIFLFPLHFPETPGCQSLYSSHIHHSICLSLPGGRPRPGQGLWLLCMAYLMFKRLKNNCQYSQIERLYTKSSLYLWTLSPSPAWQ